MGTDLITGGVSTSLFPVPSRTRSPSDYPASGWGHDGFPLALERARTSRGLNGKVSRSVLGPTPCQYKCRTGFLNCARSSHGLWLLAGRAPAPLPVLRSLLLSFSTAACRFLFWVPKTGAISELAACSGPKKGASAAQKARVMLGIV